MTAKKDNLLKISQNYLDFTNTKSGMQEAANDDATYGSEFLGGQNPFQYFAPCLLYTSDSGNVKALFGLSHPVEDSQSENHLQIE